MSKKTLNTTNLETLGAQKLAALLIEVSTGSADIKRRLRLELSHNLGASELAQDVRKRLMTLRKSVSFVGWRKRKALIKDLNTQVAMITDKIAPDDPTAAFDLLWLFIEIAPSIYGRCDDSKGDVGDVFRAAIDQFEDIAPGATLDPDALADRVWAALQDNGYGEWDGIIGLVAPALGQSGLARLTSHVERHGAEPIETASDDHDAIRFLRQLRGGDDYAAVRKAQFVKECLQDIATVAGDTTAFIAQYSEDDLKSRDIAAEIAQLLLDDGQPQDALALLENADQADPDGGPSADDAWNAALIVTLTTLGRIDDAQGHRWACFTETLHDGHLRAYLKLLPDFEDVEAEDRARRHVASFPSLPAALNFCLNWPDLVTAAQLVHTRADEISATRSTIFLQAAEALRARHPLSAVLIWRAMIDDILIRNQIARYGDASDHLAECTALDADITSYGNAPSHAEYVQTLQTKYASNSAFWTKVR